MVKTRACEAEAACHGRGPNGIRVSLELVAGKTCDDVAGIIVAARNAVEESFDTQNHIANLVIVAKLAATREGTALAGTKGAARRIVDDSALAPSASNVGADIKASPGEGQRSVNGRGRRLYRQIRAGCRDRRNRRESDGRRADPLYRPHALFPL